VDEQVCRMLGTGTQMLRGENLRAGVDRHPQPEHVLRAAQPGANFIQLQVWEVQMGEGALVQGLGMLSSTGQPACDR
jgi:hypothetical protein